MAKLRLCSVVVACLVAGAPASAAAQQTATAASAAAPKSMPQRIADLMVQLNGGIHPGVRFTHAKGLVLTGTFTPAPTARSVSRAAHLQAAPVPVTVRFSDGTGNPAIADTDPLGAPRGMAVRFDLPGGKSSTDIVANSHNGFFVGNADDFLAFLEAIVASPPTAPHPSPIEKFLGAHPRALKVITDSRPLPKSFATLGYFGNNAFVFVDAAGTKRTGRYQIVPVAGVHHLDSAAAAKGTPNYLFDELRARVKRSPVQFRLFVQLANPGDRTDDGSIVWPDDRKRVELGTISIAAVAPKNDELQRALRYDPIHITDGIQLSDDPLVPLRAAVYALSTQHRK